MARPTLIWKRTCDTCRRYKRQLDDWGVDYESREMNAAPLAAEEVAELIGDRPVRTFLNPRNERYRELGLAKAPPDTTTAVQLIAETNNLLRRPVLVLGDQRVVGNDLDAAAALLGRTR